MRTPSISARSLVARATAAVLLGVSLVACGAPAQNAEQQPEAVQTETPQSKTAPTEATGTESPANKAAAPADGTYQIEVETDSSMFRSERCTLVVKDGTYTATLVLPGEGFSKLYFGSAQDAASAPADEVYEYTEGEDGKYTFELPVSALDEPLKIAAYGQRRDKWYDHTITFVSPAQEAQADAA